MTNYKINRFGFYNYFNYRNQVFDANTQSIVFNGENGSGKTATMLSLFPTIFLGNMRIVDSKRSLDYYVKPGEAAFAWVEFKADENIQTLLLAYNKSVDGSNTNHYYYMLKSGVKGDTVPYSTSWAEFRGAVKQFVDRRYDTQADYQRGINQLFFGFQNQSEMQEYFEHLAAFEKPPLKQTGSTADLDSALKTALPNLSHYADKATVENFIDNALAMVEEEKKKAALEKLSAALVKTEEWEELTNKPILAQIQTSKANATQDLKHKKAVYEKLTKDIANTEAEIKNIEEKQSELQADLTAKEAEFNAIQAVLAAKNLEELARQIEQGKQEAQIRQRDLTTTESELRNVQKRLTENEQTLFNEQQLLESQKNELAKLEEKLPAYTDQVEFAQKYSDADQLIAKQGQLLTKLTQLKKQNQKLLSQLEMLNQEINSFNEDAFLDRIHDALSQLNQETATWLSEREISFDQTDAFDLDDYEERKKIVSDTRAQYQEAIIKTENAITDRKVQLSQLIAELRTLKEHHKPETTAEFAKGKQLFELVDFKDDVPSDLQLQIESDLKYSNLLYALFDGEDIQTGLEAKSYSELSNLGNGQNNLADYLVSQDERVNDFLKAIAVEDGHIQFASLAVHSQKGAAITHIGESNREKERERQIAELNAQIVQGQAELNKLVDQRATYQQLFDQADPASFPSSDHVKEANIAYQTALSSQERRLEQQARLNQQLVQFRNERNQLVEAFCPDLPTDELAFFQYRSNWQGYQNLQRDLSKQKEAITRQNKRVDAARDHLSQSRQEAGDKEGQVKLKENRLQEILQTVQTLQEQLDKIRNDPETKEQEARASELKHLLKDLERELSYCNYRLSDQKNILKNDQEALPSKKDAFEKLNKEYEEISKLLDQLKLTDKVKNASPADWENDTIKKANRNRANLDTIAINEINNETEYRVKNDKFLEFVKLPLENKDLIQVQSLLGSIAVVHYYFGDKELVLDKLYSEINQQLESFRASADDEVQRLARYLNNSTILQKIRQATAEATSLTKQISKSLREKEQTNHISFYTTFSEIPDYKKDYLAAFGNTSLDSPETQKAINMLMDRFWTFIKDNNEEMTKEELVNHFYEEFDYKKWYRFNISFRRHANEPQEKMTDRKLNAFSEGQRSRAILEPLLIVLELDEKKMTNPKAPKIILMDESFSGIDDEQQELLLKNIYDIADNFIATGYNARLAVPENSKDTSYFTLIDHTIDGKNHFISVDQSIVKNNLTEPA